MSQKALPKNNSKPFDNPGQQPLILAIETSGRTGSIALAVGHKILGEKKFSAKMRHSAEIIPSIKSLLEQHHKKTHQIKHLYISIGPGSFTGLRIAVTIAKTMHLANNQIKIVEVDTLDAIASNVIDLYGCSPNQKQFQRIGVILDAKKGLFFTAVFEKLENHWQKISQDQLLTINQFVNTFCNSNRPLWLLGEGLVYNKDKFKNNSIEFFDESYWFPCAAKIAQLGYQKAMRQEFTNPLKLQPNYIKLPDVDEKQILKS